MPELLFTGVGHRLFAFGKELRRGESAHFTEMEAETLGTMRNIRMTEIKSPKKTTTPAPAATVEPEALEGEGPSTEPEPEEN